MTTRKEVSVQDDDASDTGICRKNHTNKKRKLKISLNGDHGSSVVVCDRL